MLFEAGFLIEPKAHRFGWAGWPTSSREPPITISVMLELQMCAKHLASCTVLGIWTQFFIVAQQPSYWQSHVPILDHVSLSPFLCGFSRAFLCFWWVFFFQLTFLIGLTLWMAISEVHHSICSWHKKWFVLEVLFAQLTSTIIYWSWTSLLDVVGCHLYMGTIISGL